MCSERGSEPMKNHTRQSGTVHREGTGNDLECFHTWTCSQSQDPNSNDI